MRGRFHALALTVAGSGSFLFCWISAALLALVTLRKGVGNGAWLLLWALLPPAVLMYSVGDSGPLSLIVGTTLLAAVLRVTVNLPLAVSCSILVGALSGLVLLLAGGQFMEQMLGWFDQFLVSLEQQLSQGGEQVTLGRPGALQLSGLMGAGSGMLSVLCLLLARYWQAELYNPGGFGTEFRALRYAPAAVFAMLVPALLLSGMGAEYRTWAVLPLLPLNFAGLALVHARVHARGQGAVWIGAFYVAWLVFDPLKLVVIGAAVADSWFDFRQRWARKSGRDIGRRDGD